jgi:hypothetical protein
MVGDGGFEPGLPLIFMLANNMQRIYNDLYIIESGCIGLLAKNPE